MAYEVGRRPGGWVAQRAAEKSRLVWAVAVVLVGLAVLSVGFAVSGRATVFSSVLAIGLAFALKRYSDKRVDDAVRWLSGARAEETVGTELEKLRPEFVVMHDLDHVGPGNVDHVVSGPTGVFMVETKFRRYEDDDLLKARGRAARIHDDLGVWVTPVICLATREDEPFPHDRVWVVPRTRINEWIKAQRNQPVEFERLACWADSL